jgi:hypothetical protein
MMQADDMETPTLPTDNLYKFMALAGVASLVFLFYFGTRHTHELLLESVRADSQISVLEIELEFLREDYVRDSRELTNIMSQRESVSKGPEEHKAKVTQEGSNALLLQGERLEQNTLERLKHLKELKLKVQDVQNSRNLQAAIKYSVARFRWLFAIGLGLAGALAVYGFFNWYKRVQFFQDQILRNEASKIAPKKIARSRE